MKIKYTNYVNDGFNYQIFDEDNYYIGQFKNNQLNGWGLKSSKKETIRGYFIDNKLNGLGIIYHNEEDTFKVEAGIYIDDKLIPIEEIKETYPKHEIEWMSHVKKEEIPHKVTYYGDLTSDNFPKGKGLVVDDNKIYYGNWTEDGYRSGMFICPVGEDSFEDIYYVNESGLSNNEWVHLHILNSRIASPYKRVGALAKYEAGRYGVIYHNNFHLEGYISFHKELDGLGYAYYKDKISVGLYKHNNLYFGISSYEPKDSDKDIQIDGHYLVLPKHFIKKHKVVNLPNGHYIGELDKNIPEGMGLLYQKDNDYIIENGLGNIIIIGEFTDGINDGLYIKLKYDNNLHKYILLDHYVSINGKYDENYTVLDYYLHHQKELITNN